MAMASIEAAAELKRATSASAAASDRRAAEAASPYARMGIIDDASPAFDDLDAVLRRRRQAG